MLMKVCGDNMENEISNNISELDSTRLEKEDISKDLMELTNGKIQIQYIQDIETECVI